jgi:hypothetical protein
MLSSRRQFLQTTAATTACLGLGDLGLLDRLPHVSAAEAVVPPRVVRFSAEIEPLVRLLEETPRERLLEEIFADISHDRLAAASKTLAWLEQNPTPTEFITAARRFVFLKGNNAHDYKFSSAVLEDYQNVSPARRGRYLATSVFNLRGSGDPDNELVKRTRAALA